MSTEKETEFLRYINRNAKMGADNLETVIDGMKNMELMQVLSSQVSEYREVEKQSEGKLSALGEKPSESGFTGMCARMMINAKTMMDSSEQHIAEMVIKGSTAGIIDITKQLKNYSECCPDSINLAYRLKAIEQKNLDEMKHYL